MDSNTLHAALAPLKAVVSSCTMSRSSDNYTTHYTIDLEDGRQISFTDWQLCQCLEDIERSKRFWRKKRGRLKIGRFVHWYDQVLLDLATNRLRLFLLSNIDGCSTKYRGYSRFLTGLRGS